MSFDDLEAAIDQPAETDPHELADPASTEELHRQLTRLDAVVTAATAAFDSSPHRPVRPTTQENGRLLCPFHNRLRNTRPPPT